MKDIERPSDRELRLSDAHEREARPWFARIRDWYEAGRVAVFMAPFVLAALLLVAWPFGLADEAWRCVVVVPCLYAVWPAAFVLFYARDIHARLEVRWPELEAWIARRWSERTKRRKVTTVPAMEERGDAYDGVLIDTIASAIVAHPEGKLTLKVLEGAGLRTTAATRVQKILRERSFLVYPRTLKQDAHPIGEERIAYVNEKASNAVMLNPLLLRDEVQVGDRVRIIGNAIRRDRGITPLPEPRVVSEKLTVMGVPLSHVERTFRTLPPARATSTALAARQNAEMASTSGKTQANPERKPSEIPG